MTATFRIHRTDPQRSDLRALARARATPASLRARREMIALADAGQTVPQIARFLGRHEQTVRRWVKAFLAEGLRPWLIHAAIPVAVHVG